jgi:hypothetical protein
MNRNEDKTVHTVAEHRSPYQVVDKKAIEALEVKFNGAHSINLSNDETQLLRSILHEYAQQASSTPSPRTSKPTRLTNFATVAGTGAVTGLLCVVLFPTQPIVAIVVAIVATIAAKLALPWMDRL